MPHNKKHQPSPLLFQPLPPVLQIPPSPSTMLKIYQFPVVSPAAKQVLLVQLQSFVTYAIRDVKVESVYYLDCLEPLTTMELEQVKWMLKPHLYKITLSINKSHFSTVSTSALNSIVVEIGPKLSLQTAFSINALSICSLMGGGLGAKVTRFEAATRYNLKLMQALTARQEQRLISFLSGGDGSMERYLNPPLDHLPSSFFGEEIGRRGRYEVSLLKLKHFSTAYGLQLTETELRAFERMFTGTLHQPTPTSVELFSLAQASALKRDQSLVDILFGGRNMKRRSGSGNGSGGFVTKFVTTPDVLVQSDSTKASVLKLIKKQTRQICINTTVADYSVGVAPFHGASVAVGTRIREGMTSGRGGAVLAGLAGYSFGDLAKGTASFLEGKMASAREALLHGSAGVADYQNKFGEPLVGGFCRSIFGISPSAGRGGENVANLNFEYLKPIVFSGGVGVVEEEMAVKRKPKVGLCIVKVGGLPYRSGLGGARRAHCSLGPDAKQDAKAISRGDAEVQQKLYRVIRGCIEHKDGNPLQSVGSQGPGGNALLLSRLTTPLGATVFTSNFKLGDASLNALELINAEYQESVALLIEEEAGRDRLNALCRREKVSADYVGVVSGSGHLTVFDDDNAALVDLPVEALDVVPKVSPISYLKSLSITSTTSAGNSVSAGGNDTSFEGAAAPSSPLLLPPELTLEAALQAVLSHPSVCSKRFLTAKVDRCVGGLVAQQQCIGPCHTPLADYGLVALNYFSLQGCVSAVGEQPLKGLLSPAANARLSVIEALTNLVCCAITKLEDVKLALVWAWPSNLGETEANHLYQTAEALVDFCRQLGVTIESSVESLNTAVLSSEAASEKIAAEQQSISSTPTTKPPGTLIVTAYAPVPDIRVKVTPECAVTDTCLIYLNFKAASQQTFRLGGSILAQTVGQLGAQWPDVENVEHFKTVFTTVQTLIREGTITAGHDVSDGGLVVALLEMAFATNCGLKVNFEYSSTTCQQGEEMGAREYADFEVLFAEEPALLLEVPIEQQRNVMKAFNGTGLNPQVIGRAVEEDWVEIAINGVVKIKDKMTILREVWEATSFELQKLQQVSRECVEAEQRGLKSRKSLNWTLTYDPTEVKLNIDSHLTSAPKVAVLREEGSNCDREMSAAFFMVGCDVADVTVTDLITGAATLDYFQGLVFAGGFSYSDVLGSARGWAATLLYNEAISAQLGRFRARPNTFALGCCNGCQLMTLLGWVGEKGDGSQGTMLAPNASGRFECRFVNVLIPEETPAIMFRGMGGSVMGVWAVHGEGQFVFESPQVENAVKGKGLVSLLYVDDDAQPTSRYPHCPNGSSGGVAGIASEDGRCLALMPHPDRAALAWQLPYVPRNMKSHFVLKGGYGSGAANAQSPSPPPPPLLGSHWARMFENAYRWAVENA